MSWWAVVELADGDVLQVVLRKSCDAATKFAIELADENGCDEESHDWLENDGCWSEGDWTVIVTEVTNVA